MSLGGGGTLDRKNRLRVREIVILFYFFVFACWAGTSRLGRQNFDKIPKDNNPTTKRENNYIADDHDKNINNNNDNDEKKIIIIIT